MPRLTENSELAELKELLQYKVVFCMCLRFRIYIYWIQSILYGVGQVHLGFPKTGLGDDVDFLHMSSYL